MGRNSFLKSPKREEQVDVPEYSIDVAEFFETNGDHYNDIMDDEFGGILGIKDEEQGEGSNSIYDDHEINWDLMDMEEFSFNKCHKETEDDNHRVENSSLRFTMVKREDCDEDDDEKKVSLNLSLNYQEVMEAWSDRGSLWAEDRALSPDATYGYMGEVPVIEEDKSRREASVLRYKEKRQNRLFAKKIRYEVRKLNADKRPRLKGRFVKRES